MQGEAGISGVQTFPKPNSAIIRYFAPDLPASKIAELSGAARRLISYSY